MGKRLISQRRGRGTSTFRFPGFRFKGSPAHLSTQFGTQEGKITKFITPASNSGPLAFVTFSNNKQALILAPEGVRVGDKVTFNGSIINPGCTLALKDIPEGTLVHNIECTPGDGGKLVRASGGSARVRDKIGEKIRIVLPSKKVKHFNAACRASVGIVAGGGRKEKPLIKAGNAHHRMRARNKLYPRSSGVAMNAVAHPFGGTSSSTKGRPTIARKHAPAGAKVGMLSPRRSGRRKR